MGKPMDFDDPFERAGVWWLASNPDNHVAGTLTYSPEAGVVLQLVGAFGSHPFAGIMRSMASMRYETIHGVTVDGKQVSLLRAVQRNTQVNFPGISLESYMAIWLLIGAHCGGAEDPMFEASLVRFEGLDAWLARQPFEEVLTQDPRRLHMTMTPMEDLSLGRLSAEGAEVFARMTLDTTGDRLTHFEATVRNVLGLKPDQPQSLLWHVDQVEKLNRLVSLCSGRHLPLRSLRLVGSEQEISPGIRVPQEVDLLMLLNERVGDTDSGDPPVFSAAELFAGNAGALDAWSMIEDSLKPVLDLFFTVVSSRGLYSDVAFLLAVQAWEVHHRLTQPGPLMPKAAFKTLRKTLVEAIPEGVSADMKAKLESVLSYANEPSLRQRLDACMVALAPDFGPVPFGFDAKTLKAVVDSRNYYTHYSSALKSKALARGELVQLTRRIVPLMYALILSDLGLAPEAVREHLKRRRGFASYVTTPDA